MVLRKVDNDSEVTLRSIRKKIEEAEDDEEEAEEESETEEDEEIVEEPKQPVQKMEVKKQIKEKKITQVIDKIPTTEIRRYPLEDGTEVTLITPMEALTEMLEILRRLDARLK